VMSVVCCLLCVVPAVTPHRARNIFAISSNKKRMKKGKKRAKEKKNVELLKLHTKHIVTKTNKLFTLT